MSRVQSRAGTELYLLEKGFGMGEEMASEGKIMGIFHAHTRELNKNVGEIG